MSAHCVSFRSVGYACLFTPTSVSNHFQNAVLGIYEHPFEGAWTGNYDPSAPYPKKFTIDYFRAYQPNGGYVK